MFNNVKIETNLSFREKIIVALVYSLICFGLGIVIGVLI